jgi:hypothetical protein
MSGNVLPITHEKIGVSGWGLGEVIGEASSGQSNTYKYRLLVCIIT